ncbi:MAG: deoxyribose-phosphate aldolase [Saprospirales bacterium]|jgi:deoxyribose-phosphate aldolase|nr:deoxyribose-phosphate aldolase [Saprospirales bacterium]MBK7336089.1 deoxyribose-phosphate aldolase [Saprospirales bacterium]
MQLAEKIDHTILKPDCTLKDIQSVCEEAISHRFYSVCVPPFYVKDAFQFLEKTNVKVTTVVGFPMGYATTPAKVEEIKRAIDDGAEEVDAVVNICAVKSGNWNYVRNDVDSMTRIAHMRGKTIKVILETGMMTQEELDRLCKVCIESEVDFVKTSTGILAAGANVDIVSWLRAQLPPSIKIKASGGLRSYQDAVLLIEAGAARLGSSASVQIVQGGK